MDSSNPLPIPTALRPIRALDTAPRWTGSDAQTTAPRWVDSDAYQRSVVRHRRPSGSDVSPRLVFAALRILLEHICDDQDSSKRLYHCLQKKLEKFFVREHTPKYDLTHMLSDELDRFICEIARLENIQIHMQRCRRCSSRSLVPRVEKRPMPNFHNFKQNYTFIKMLGEGGFGKVYHVRHELDKVEYAVKEIPLKLVMKENEKAENDKITREVVILAQLDHINIVRYFTAWVEVNNVGSPLQRLPSLELPTTPSDESSSLSANGASGGILIEEMSPRSPPRSLLDPPAIEDLRSSDFVRPDPPGWSTGSWGDEEEVAAVEGPESSSSETPLRVRKRTTHGYSVSEPRGDLPGRSWSVPASREEGRVVPLKEAARMFGLPTLGSVLYIQMQLCDTSLKQWLRDRNRRIREGEVVDRKMSVNLFEQIVRGLRYIHARCMIHRDIKPANILLVVNPDGSTVVKLADFGLTTFAMDCARTEVNCHSPRQLSSRIGTRFYAAPEQRNGREYGHQADMYSAGLILFELFQPVDTESELMIVSNGLRGDPVTAPPDFAGRWPDVAECVTALVNKDPNKRPTAEHILNDCALLHNWRSLRTENDSLRQRVVFLESENRDLREQLEKLRLS